MAGICSHHQGYDADCELCNATPAQLLGVSEEQWQGKVAEAEAAGVHTCTNCGFEFYLTVSKCPLCSATAEVGDD